MQLRRTNTTWSFVPETSEKKEERRQRDEIPCPCLIHFHSHTDTRNRFPGSPAVRLNAVWISRDEGIHADIRSLCLSI